MEPGLLCSNLITHVYSYPSSVPCRDKWGTGRRERERERERKKEGEEVEDMRKRQKIEMRKKNIIDIIQGASEIRPTL